MVYVIQVLLTACEQDQDGTNAAIWYNKIYREKQLAPNCISIKINEFHPDPARKLSADLYDIYHCCLYSEKLLTMGRGTVRNM